TLDDPALFINREVSWIRFNYRVLEEAQDSTHPLLERVKFLAISGSNLDEFFMTRASVLEEQIERGDFEPTPGSRMTPLQQIKVTRSEILPLLKSQRECWDQLAPLLAQEGIRILEPKDLSERQNRILRDYFQREILPVMKKPNVEYVAPFISNLHVNLLVVVDDPRMKEALTKLLVESPSDSFGRFVNVPLLNESHEDESNFVLLEDLVAANLDLLLPSTKIVSHHKFRVTRNAEIEVRPDKDTDFLTTMELSVRQRRYGRPARLEFETGMPHHLRDYLSRSVGSIRLPSPEDVHYEIDAPFGLVDFWRFLKLNKPKLKDTPFNGYIIPELEQGKPIFGEIAARDYALYHPYDSFDMVVNLLEDAATDPDVTDVYITLYRIDPDSPVISSLMKAASNGKSVTALIELKAKFDEANNMKYAKLLTGAGVKVLYNFPKIKVHAKLALIVRKESNKSVQYSHIGSGNYNSVTTRIYGDIGYLTANPEISGEVLDLFHKLTTDPRKAGPYTHLLVAPTSLKSEILTRIDREIKVHEEKRGGYLAFKMNGLVDKKIIQALYRASQAGVRIDLNVRGLCCLRPGIPGVSENIRVVSIVGRFLEHARIYYFKNGGQEEVLLGSSDMMPRNLEKRVEVLFSVPDPAIKSSILRILDIHLRDNVKARLLLQDGTYQRVKPQLGEEIVDSQMWLINNRGAWHANTNPA
ncbi:MAG TPA: polyphosphate kinase 1, partial [Candidatus Dormibacteraeota bacterium]|nr:polyphosphate kinase 1 [Candidatus Dormibacteraeota bacterium]